MTSVLDNVLQALGRSDSGTASSSDAKPTAAVQAPATPQSVIDDQVKDIMKGMADMRSLLQRAGSLLAAGGAAVVGGLGYQQLNNFFPLPPYWGFWHKALLAVLMLTAALTAALGVAWLARRFLTAQARILLSSDPASCEDLHGNEPRLVSDTYAEIASQELAAGLPDIDLRSQRLARVARAADPALASGLQTESDRLNSVVQLGIYSAAASVLERRSSDAFRGKRTATALVTSIVGVAFLFGIADYSKGERDKLTVVASCSKVNTSPKGQPVKYPKGVSNWCKT